MLMVKLIKDMKKITSVSLSDVQCGKYLICLIYLHIIYLVRQLDVKLATQVYV